MKEKTMSSKDRVFEDAVEWRPELTPEGRARVEAHAARFRKGALRFRALREMLGLTQVEAARRLSTTQGNISKIEERRSIDVERLQALVEGTGFEVVVLVRGHGQEMEITG